MIKIAGKIKYGIALIGLFAYLLVSFGNFQQTVICFEPDGRVELEALVAGSCDDAWQPDQITLKNGKTAVQTFHRKKCVDIPLTLSNATLHKSVSVRNAPLLVQDMLSARTAEPVSGQLETFNEPRFPNPPPLRSPAHRFLNTIVLLI